LRLTFAYDGSDIRLVRSQRVEMIAPPSVTEPPQEGHVGHWLEIRDAAGKLLYHRHVHQPIRTDTEAFGSEDKPAMTRAARAKPGGQFTLLVPDLPGAASFHFFGPAHGGRGKAASATAPTGSPVSADAARGHAAASVELVKHSFAELRQTGANRPDGSPGPAGGEAHP
jgi:hypothetical protein